MIILSYKIEKKDIISIASNNDVYNQGLKYFRMGRTKNFTHNSYDDQSVVTTEVEDNIKDYKASIFFRTSGELKSYSCSCTESIMWKGACKHIVCALLKLEEHSQKINNEIKMEKGVENIIELFEKHTYENITNKLYESNMYLDKVRINPCIHLTDKGEIYVTFSIGISKYYIIRDIIEFIDNIDNEKIYNYGKELEFKHDIKVFDNNSKHIISFIKKVLKIYNSSPYYNDIDKKLYIKEDEVDNFFNIYKNEVIDINIKDLNSKSVLIMKDTPKDIFYIEQKEEPNTLNLKYNPLEFTILKGFNFDYLLTEKFLYKVEKPYTRILTSILGSINEVENNTLTFKDKDYHSFINFVYPMLKSMNMIDKSLKSLANLEDLKFKAKIYFDYIDKKLTCKILFQYREHIINPQENMSEEVLRNNIKEYEVLELIKIYGFEEDGNKGYSLSKSDKIYNFYLDGLEEVKEISEVYMSEEFIKKNINSAPKTFIKVGIKGNLLELNFDTSSYDMKELLDAVNSYKLKKRYFRFKDGSYIDLDNKEISFMSEIISTLGLGQDDFLQDSVTLPKYRAIYINDISNELDTEFVKDSKVNKLLKDFNNIESLNFTIPKALDSIMRSYQKVGYNWLKVLNYYGFGGILADDMGLGKTIQAISFLLSEKDTIPSLIVAPTSLIYNWEREINKFAENLSVVVLTGTALQRKKLFINSKNVDIFITTYDTLKKDINMYTDYKFKFIIADEAQNIKNHNTQNSKTIRRLKSYNRFALTGTPIENSVTELWSIFDFVMPGYLFEYSKFLKTYAYPIMKDKDKNKEYQLRKQIQPFILRRVKSDVLKELPEKVEITIYAEMTNEQKKIYLYNLLKARGEFEKIIEDKTFNKNQILILSSLTRLRQICCHPSLFVENYKGGSGKLNLALEYVNQAIADGNRILLFSQFTSMLDIIRSKFIEQNIKYLYIDGSTCSKERINLIDKFNNGYGEVFLISLKSGGTGLNLTGANVVIHYDQWWNPSVMNQATDRAHRYGQDKVVQVVNMVIKDTIEEKILQLHQKKKDLTNAVIKEGGKFINNMTKEDLIDIFNI